MIVKQAAAEDPVGGAAPIRAERPALGWILLLWAMTFALIAYLAATTDFGGFLRALHEARLGMLIAAVAGFALAVYWLDVVTLRFLLQASGHRIGRAAVMRLRAVAYLWQTIHYGLGLAYMTGSVSWSSRRSLTSSASPLLLLAAADISTICGALLLGLVVAGAWLPESIPWWPALAMGVGGFALLPGACLLSRFPGLMRLLGRHGQSLGEAARALSAPQILKLYLLRAVVILVYITAEALFLRSFDFRVPLPALLLFEPLILLVVALPIAVYGIGTSQIAMRFLFSDFVPNATAPEAAVDAYSTATILAIIAVRLVLGVAAMLFLTRRRSKPTTQGGCPRG